MTSADQNKIRVLYLDPSESGRALVRDFMQSEQQQIEIIEVHSRSDLQACLDRNQPDLLIIDPIIDGELAVDLLDWLATRHPQLPTVLVMDSRFEEIALQTIRDCVADYVIKTPERIHRLPYSIRLALEKSRLLAERQKAEEELRRLTEHLERRVAERTAELAAANQELEAFSYSVSHDLRAPLRAIEGFAKILLEDYGQELQPDAKRCVDIIVASTEQTNRLIEDLLRFSRLTRADLAKREIDMTELASAVAEEIRRDDPNKNARVTIAPLPPARGDPALIRQVWINLLSNAFKFSRKNPSPAIEVGAQPEDDHDVYHVRDNGVGFDMQYAHKLFNVFQRLHRSDQFEGTGVGLAIVKRIVQRHGGRVWADATPGNGATFFFSLPRNDAPQ